MPRQVDFATFCHATRAWLASAPSPDPALVAAAELLDADPSLDDRSLLNLSRDATDAHALLGATTLIALLHLAGPPDW